MSQTPEKQIVSLQLAESDSKKSEAGLQDNGEIANLFLKIGLDLKGQSQSCFKSSGFRLQLGAVFDPLKIHTLGCLSSSIKAEASGSSEMKMVMVVQVGPKQVGDYMVDTPILLNFCQGRQYSASANLSLFMGLSYEFGGESSFVHGSANIGALASGSASGTYYHAINLQPLPFTKGNLSQLRDDIASLYLSMDYKEFLKRPAVSLINKYGGQISLKKKGYVQSIMGSNIETKTLVSKLEDIKKDPSVRPEQRAMATTIQKNLQDFKEHELPPTVTSLRIFLGKVSGMGKLSADFGVVGNVAGLIGIDVASANTLLNVSGSYVPIYVRFQSVYPARWIGDQIASSGYSARNSIFSSNRPSFFATREAVLERPSLFFQSEGLAQGSSGSSDCSVVLTQDTKLTYSTYEFSALNSKTKVALTFDEREVTHKDLEASWANCVENRMSYETTSIYWLTSKTPQTKQTTLPGSGVSFGCSFRLEDLKQCLTWRGEDLLPTEVVEEEDVITNIRETIDDFREVSYEVPVEVSPPPGRQQSGATLAVDASAMELDENLVFAACLKRHLDKHQEYMNSFLSKKTITYAVSNYATGGLPELVVMPHETYMTLNQLLERRPIYPHLLGAVEWLVNGAGADTDPAYVKLFKKRLTKRGLRQWVPLETTQLQSYNKSDLIMRLSNALDEYGSATGAIAQPLPVAEAEVHKEMTKVTKTIAGKAYVFHEVHETIRKVTFKDHVLSDLGQRRHYLIHGCDIPEIERILSPKRNYMLFIAAQLRLKLEHVYDFLTSSDYLTDLICNYKSYKYLQDVDSIILEAGYLMEGWDIDIVDTQDQPRSIFMASTPTRVIDLSQKSVRDLSKAFNDKFRNTSDWIHPNVIRMRFRMQDRRDDSSKPHRLGGEKVLGNTVEIQLKKIKEVGSDGILDLYTRWNVVNRGWVEGGESDYERGVPAVALFSQ